MLEPCIRESYKRRPYCINIRNIHVDIILYYFDYIRSTPSGQKTIDERLFSSPGYNL